jgi:hypothetical protein
MMKMNAHAVADEAEVQNSQKPRHLKLLSEKKGRPTEFFYKVSNPGQLAKIGQSYLEDFKNGIKSFAISSTNYKSSQQRTVLALASYFDHLFDMKILIISDSLQKGVFEEVMGVRKLENVPVEGTNHSIEVNHFYHHFDLVDLNLLLKLSPSHKPNYDFETAVNQLMKSYDLILWDTPIINTQKNNSVVYSHTIHYFESLTIVVAPAVTKASDVNAIKEHFSNLGVNVKGVLFDSPESYESSGSGNRVSIP